VAKGDLESEQGDKMNIKNIIEQVELERLYQHVLELEGVKHPIISPQRLLQARDYITETILEYGVSVHQQEFHVDGWDEPFYNIEGVIGDENTPCAVLINHYDNVWNDPGANDNAAGIAIMLEAARILSQEENVPPVRFVSASLEEGHPALESAEWASAKKHKILDEKLRFTSLTTRQAMQKFEKMLFEVYLTGKSYRDAITDALDAMQGTVPVDVWAHMQNYLDIYGDLKEDVGIGETTKIGSSIWVEEALELGKPIRYNICLDEIGTTNKEKGSQKLDTALTYDMMQLYRVDPEAKVADWAFIVSDGPSEWVAEALCAHCRHEGIDLPYGYIPMGVDYQGIIQTYPQATGSDHAPFWRASIPAICITDTAGWRNPYCHSMADTIDKLDFQHITKLCKAVIATLATL
jgi:hypothetical protein